MPRHLGAGLTGLLLACLLLAAPPALGTADEAPRPSIGLALGSGGASGLAHIAILQVFDELEIQPDHIAGTSIGAVIGGLYAAGLSADEILDLFDDFGGSPLDALSELAGNSELGITDLVQLGLGEGGLLDSSGFLHFLASHTEVREFSELRIPLSVVATDYWSGESVVLDEGELFPALAASMAVPGLFKPSRRDHQLLIDGGTSNPLPFDLLQGRVDRVIAVDVTGRREPVEGEVAGITDLLFKTFEIMQQSITRQMVRHQPPDLYLQPDVAGVRLLHFNRVMDVLAQAQPTADELRERLEAWQAETAQPGIRQDSDDQLSEQKGPT
ncbi:patatin-like phospholipase family protein [Halomonas campisalis]|uniref:Patatin-like phospholipase family protein n=1 Tax=Billgrantia campisalis TaxID=74661 RepID=A0ABS9P717_9GAMM|nr:patatin-like phospholipase family protein [Halomonas campisalis]MCG6657568.1 patatin-like phospholipase family protein [Halomonas campisalis]MDR5862658.1 patatin-like phospholipase family protein [Halomonas campisalis]